MKELGKLFFLIRSQHAVHLGLEQLLFYLFINFTPPFHYKVVLNIAYNLDKVIKTKLKQI